jgi:hypothetical protein
MSRILKGNCAQVVLLSMRKARPWPVGVARGALLASKNSRNTRPSILAIRHRDQCWQSEDSDLKADGKTFSSYSASLAV